MKKVININFQGMVVPIEESAYELLRQYIDSLRQYFAEEEGRDEIINDIESRISELFQNKLKNGVTCITDVDVNSILDNMGRPKDFDEAETNGSSSGPKEKTSNAYSEPNWQHDPKRLYRNDSHKILGGVCSGIGAYLGVDPWIVRILFIISGVGLIAYIILWIFLPGNNSLSTGIHKKLYRNPEDKIIGGVCGGIGTYFNINSWIPRVIFLLPFISILFWLNHVRITFGPGTFLIYIILWLVIPEAKTTSEKLEMKGEKVDLNSIKESVVKEMKDVGERMEKFGKDAGNYMKDKGPEMRNEFSQSASNSAGVLGRVIVTLVKIFVYIILGAVAFAVLMVVFAIAVTAIGIFPLKDFIVADGWQNVLAWLTLIFFIGIPVVGTITFIIRKLAKRKSNNNYIRIASIGLWVFGWICMFALISYVGRDFKYISKVNEQSIILNDSSVGLLEIKPIKTQDYRWKGWLSFEPYSTFGISDDTALVANVRLKIYKAGNDQFSVNYFKMSNGHSKDVANRLASQVSFYGYQQDSTLYLDNIIPINTTDKFRNQFVEVAIYVPVNHRIMINRGFYNSRRSQFRVFMNDEDFYFRRSQYDGFRFEYGTEYIMKTDGLHMVNESADENDESSDVNKDGSPYRYKGPLKIDSLKIEQEKQIQKMERSVDSAKEAHRNEMKSVQDSLLKQRDEINKKLENIKTKVSSVILPPAGRSLSELNIFFSII